MHETIYTLLENWRREDPEAIYLEDDERTYTIEEVFQIVNSLMKQLQELNLGKEVLLRATRNVQTMLLFYSVISLGSICYLSTPHEKASTFLKEQNLQLSVLSDEEGAFSFDGKPLSFTPTEERVCPQDTFEGWSFVLFTSGSTGRRKGVKLSQKSLLLGDFHTIPLADYRKDDVSGAILPLDHVFGLCLILACLLTRHRAYFPKEMAIPSLIRHFKMHQVSRLNGVPSLYLALAMELEKQKTSLPRLRIGLLGGSPSNKEQILILEEKLHMKLLPIYGMTECCTISVISFLDGKDKQMNTLGRVYPHVQVCLQPIEGSPYQEILIKSEGLFLSYLEDDNPFEKDGFFHTGDIGYLDSDGYLILTGRKKDIIIRNGQNIVSRVLEDAFLIQKEVREAAVVAKQDDKEGEIPFLFLSLKEEVEVGRLLERANSLLKKNERVTQYRVLKDLCHTSSGKIDKVALRELI